METTLKIALLAVTLSLTALAPVHAASSDYLLKLPPIDGELAQSEDALMEIRADQPEAVGLLLPAVQKIREAANRLMESCTDEKGKGDPKCAAAELSAMIVASDDGRDPALSLLDLYSVGQGVHVKDAKITLRKSGEQGPKGIDQMLTGILIGLLKSCDGSVMPAAVVAPIDNALEIATSQAKGGKKGNVDYNWKVEEGES
ncbi:MAG: hypothetical protein ABI743_09640 [bacterium]